MNSSTASATQTMSTEYNCTACDRPASAESAMQLLHRLQALLLGPDLDPGPDATPAATDGTPVALPAQNMPLSVFADSGSCGDGSDSQQKLLQQLLQASVLHPSAAVSAFHPTSGHPAAYQLIMTALAAGHTEAAQLLMMQQLIHNAQLQQQKGTYSGSVGSATAAAIAWPEFVVKRLSDMVLTSPHTEPHSTATAPLPVIALRLLANAAAAAAAAVASDVRGAACTPTPDALLLPIRAALAAAEDAKAASASANAAAIAAGTGRSSSYWLSSLGPAGIAALADLATNCARAGAGSSELRGDVTQLQLSLLQLINHPTAAAQGITHFTTHPTPAGSSSSNSSYATGLSHQLRLLLDGDHIDLLSSVQSSAGHSSGGSSSSSAHAVHGRPSAPFSAPSPCCSAALAICGDLTTLALEVPGAAADKGFIRGVNQLLADLINSSPSTTAQQLNWSGKPSGFTLKPTAAALCTCSTQQQLPAPAAAEKMHLDGGLSSQQCCAWAAHNRDSYCNWLRCVGQLINPQSGGGSSSDMQPDQLYDCYPQSVLESVLLLLLAQVNIGGRATAAELYRCDVSNTLQRLCNFSSTRVLRLLEMLYGVLCMFNPQLREEVLQDGNIVALSGVVRTALFSCKSPLGPTASPAAAAVTALTAAASVSPQLPCKLLLASLGRLSAAVDAASGSAFLRFVGAVGAPATATSPVAAAAGNVLLARVKMSGNGSTHGVAGGAASAAAGDHVPCVLSSSSCGLAAVMLLMLGEGVGGVVQQQQQQQQLGLAATQVFLAALSRSRAMQKLNRRQMPRGGLWSQLGPGVLRTLEQAAINPGSSNGSNGSSDGSTSDTFRPAQLAAQVKSSAAAAASKIDSDSIKPSSNVSTRCAAAAGSTNLSPGRRRAGAAAAAATAAGSNAKAAVPVAGSGAITPSADGDDDESWDEDGLRVVWNSGPSPAVAAARSAWKQHSLGDLLSWTQSSTDLYVRLLLPAGTSKNDVIVSIQPDRLTVRLSWYGRVVDGPLAKRVKHSEAHWTLDKTTAKLTPSSSSSTGERGIGDSTAPAAAAESAGAEVFTELEILLPKDVGGRFWRALFEGGVEKSHLEVLQEAISNEDDARCAPTVDELGPEAGLLYEELRERQELMVSGQWDIENSFDDFRLVIGDNTL